MTTSTEPSNPVTATAADQIAVAAVPQRFIAAWAAQDADAFAEVFADDGSLILPGFYRQGRDEIRGFMAGAFAGPLRGTRVAGDPVEIKILSTDVVVIVTEGGLLVPGETEVAAERVARACWVVTKRAGQWRLAVYQDSPGG